MAEIKKRKRRTKAELEEARRLEEEQRAKDGSGGRKRRRTKAEMEEYRALIAKQKGGSPADVPQQIEKKQPTPEKKKSRPEKKQSSIHRKPRTKKIIPVSELTQDDIYNMVEETRTSKKPTMPKKKQYAVLYLRGKSAPPDFNTSEIDIYMGGEFIETVKFITEITVTGVLGEHTRTTLSDGKQYRMVSFDYSSERLALNVVPYQPKNQ